MYKVGVLAGLFILPLVFYIFLSKGIYHYEELPVLSDPSESLMKYSNLDFKNKFSTLVFVGSNLEKSELTLFNFNEIIYKRFYTNTNFQSILFFSRGTELQVNLLKKRLATYTDISKWRFVFLDPIQIQEIAKELKIQGQLDSSMYSKEAFLMDSNYRLRGRELENNQSLYGYNMESVAVLKNEMKDDISILFYSKARASKKKDKRKI